MRWILPAMSVFLAVACGPPKPGPQANATYFWRFTSTTVTFSDACSDDPQFRTDNGPLGTVEEDTNQNGVLDPGEDVNKNGKLDHASYLVYKGSPDAKQATLMTCTTLDPSSCSPSKSGVVFNVAGAELDYATELRTATGKGMCNILDTQTWVLTDKVTTLDAEITDVLSLVDDPATCDMLEANARANSPNGKGFQGCGITFTIQAASGG